MGTSGEVEVGLTEAAVGVYGVGAQFDPLISFEPCLFK
jgi:hypothetical protein